MLSARRVQGLWLGSKSIFHRSLSLSAYDNNVITINFGDTKDDQPVSFQTVFLRDACNSTASVNPSTRQKTFSTAQVASGLEIQGTPEILNENGASALSVCWRDRDGRITKSSYTEAFLRKASKYQNRFEGKFFHGQQIYWNNLELVKDMKSLNLDYHAYLHGEKSFGRALQALNKYGICFVNGVENPRENPATQVLSEDNSLLWPVAKLGLKFGYIKPTFYGTLFDVKNDKNAKNIANTAVYLPLHMDLCYYESPPGLQLLHFIDNSTLGGENVFADSFLAAARVRERDPEAYEALKTVPLTFHYDNDGEYYYYMRPLIVEEPYLSDENGQAYIKEVNYSPPFQGPLEMHVTKEENPELFAAFLRGMVAFEDEVNNRANQFIVKSPENSCVIFNNRRVLHSRLSFLDENGGDRWLMGCYVDGDSFRSKLRINHRSL